jgi:hypothetical protein
MSDQLQRIEKKLDLILRLQGVELGEIESIASAQMDEAAIQALTAKLKASGDALAVSVSTNKPK